MSLEFTCPGCGAQGQVPEAAAGKKVKCPKCGGIGLVPPAGAPMQFAVVSEPPPLPAAVGYRCLFCGSTQPSKWVRRRTPLVTILEILFVVILGLPAAASLLQLGALDSAILGCLLVVLCVALLAGGLIAIEYLFSSWRRICPQCKSKVGD
jgi:hypothetical protein